MIRNEEAFDARREDRDISYLIFHG